MAAGLSFPRVRRESSLVRYEKAKGAALEIVGFLNEGKKKNTLNKKKKGENVHIGVR